MVEKVGEAWSIEGLTGDHVRGHAERAGGFEARCLTGEVLVVGAEAGTAEMGMTTPARRVASRKFLAAPSFHPAILCLKA